jgi:hypothetical protein
MRKTGADFSGAGRAAVGFGKADRGNYNDSDGAETLPPICLSGDEISNAGRAAN